MDLRGRDTREEGRGAMATTFENAGVATRRTIDVGRLVPLIMPAVGIVLFVAAIWTLQRELANWRLEDISAALKAIPNWAVLLALLVTAANYVFLGAYDTLALRYLNRPLPLRRSLLAGFVGYSFSHTMGMPVLTGTALRYRLYSAWGHGAVDTAGIIAFNGVTFWLGVAVMLIIGTLAVPESVERLLGFGPAASTAIGLAASALLLAYLLLSHLWRRELTLGGWRVTLPSTSLAAAQIALSTIDWLLAALVLYVLLPDQVSISYLGFASLFTAAAVAGVISHVPGGLGVFEAVLLVALPGA